MIHRLFQFLLLFICVVWLEYMFLRNYNFHKYMNRDLYENPFNDWSNKTRNSLPLKEKIVITGLARNASDRIEKNIQYCQLLGSYFSDFRIVIFENDSCDETRTLIQNICKKDEHVKLIDSKLFRDCKFRFPKLYEFGVISRERIRKMAFYRNICNSLIYKHYADYDYLLVLDFDIEGMLSISNILNSIRGTHEFEWSCMCANGRSPLPGTFGNFDAMYDAMAFCYHKTDVISSKYTNQESQSFFKIFKRYMNMLTEFTEIFNKEKRRFIEVQSAFNGLCIYKMKDICGIYYNDDFLCEHISFNNQLIENGKRIFIDLKMTICVGHQGPTQIIDFL